MASKKRRGPHSIKSKKRKKSAGQNRGKRSQPPAETKETFEHDAKRRIGHHSATAMPPLMKK
jgi:hypothetical protein